DHPRPAAMSHRGATLSFDITEQLTEQLRALSWMAGVTPFMMLLTAFAVLLSRYSGEEDIAIGAPIANRNRKEIENLIGFFVNTLVLRIDLSGSPSFSGLLKAVKKTTLEAYANQDVPFEKLVKALAPEREFDRTLLFQVAFVLQNAPLAEVPLGPLKLHLFNVYSGNAK